MVKQHPDFDAGLVTVFNAGESIVVVLMASDLCDFVISVVHIDSLVPGMCAYMASASLC